MTVLTRRKFSNVAYGSAPLQKLDVYQPVTGGPVKPWPLVLWIHGGGWLNGDKALTGVEAVAGCTGQGYVLASCNYRDSDDGPWPLCRTDVEAALDYLLSHASTYGIDTSRVAVWGASAGAHLAAHVKLTRPEVGASLCWFAPTESWTCDADGADVVAAGGTYGRVVCSLQSHEAKLLGGTLTPINPCTAPAALRESPAVTTQVLAGGLPLTPYWRIEHGTADATVPIGQARRFRDALLTTGVTPSYIERVGFGHGNDQPEWKTPAVRAEALAWLASVL